MDSRPKVNNPGRLTNNKYLLIEKFDLKVIYR